MFRPGARFGAGTIRKPCRPIDRLRANQAKPLRRRAVKAGLSCRHGVLASSSRPKVLAGNELRTQIGPSQRPQRACGLIARLATAWAIRNSEIRLKRHVHDDAIAARSITFGKAGLYPRLGCAIAGWRRHHGRQGLAATPSFRAGGFAADDANGYAREMALHATSAPDPAMLFDLPAPLAARRIVVAMSGGVDSSVVAGLAAQTGAEVIGVTLQLYDYGAATGRKGACCAGDDIRDARSVAERLGIAHYVFDHESRFREDVVERFADDYMAGRTPIPCIRCNMGPKFTDLLAMARDLGADCLATGHYVRRVEGPHGVELHRALDPARDQSYFLYGTTDEQLAYLRFPLGGLPKPQVRALAEAMGLAVAAKPDSQDICFVPDGDYAKIVRSLRPAAETDGPIVDARTGEVLGRHKGVIHYTVGQRRGLEIGGQPVPLYVTAIEPAGARVLVGPRELLGVRAARLSETNRIGAMPPPGTPLTAKVRSLARPVPVMLEGALGQDAAAQIAFAVPEYGVAPGQAAVIYAGDRVLGGGWIEATTPWIEPAAAPCVSALA